MLVGVTRTAELQRTVENTEPPSAGTVSRSLTRLEPIWRYLKDDTLADHLTEFEQDLLPEIPH